MKRYVLVPLLVGPLALALAGCGTAGSRTRAAHAPPSAVASSPAAVPASSPAAGPASSPAAGPASSPPVVANPAPVAEGSTRSSTPPLVFPATTTEELTRLEDAAAEGHQPWLCEPASVVEAYAKSSPLNWPEPDVRPLPGNMYEVRGPAGARVTVTVFKPTVGCVWEVTKVERG